MDWDSSALCKQPACGQTVRRSNLDIRRSMKSAALLIVAVTSVPASYAQKDWPTFGRDLAGTRYSTLKQLDTKNVAKLVRAWRYHMNAGGPALVAAAPEPGSSGAALPFLAGQDQAGDLPEGKDKDTLQKICVGCHELDVVVAVRRTAIGWRQNVDDMISRGAEGSDAEIGAVVQYLTKYVGKLNVNTASPQQMQEFLALPEKEAQAIVAYRERSGNIKDLEQLKAVPGVSAEKLQEKRSLIAFTL